MEGLISPHQAVTTSFVSGDKDAQIVVYGHGVAQPLEISPPLLAAWGGRIAGFNIARWVHSLSGNAKKMMAVMENAA